MDVDIIVPHMGETTTQVTILNWFKKPGDSVVKGEALLEVETDKAVMTIEAFTDGILEQILAQPGDEADALQIIGKIKSSSPGFSVEVKNPDDYIEKENIVDRNPKEETIFNPTRMAASPLARHIALEEKINIELVAGSGLGGMITADDVKRYISERAPVKIDNKVKIEHIPEENPGQKGLPLSKMRKAIAESVVLSKITIPHIYMGIEINMEKALLLRELLLEDYHTRYQVRPTITHLIIKALCLAIQKNPIVNSTYQKDLLKTHNKINVGLVVALEEGVIIPVLKDAGNKNLAQIAQESVSIVEKARKGLLSADNLTNSTITISNISGEGADIFSAIIRPPEVIILAIGSIKARSVAVEDRIIAQQTVNVVASADHRVIDGKSLSKFLAEFKNILEAPDILLK